MIKSEQICIAASVYNITSYIFFIAEEKELQQLDSNNDEKEASDESLRVATNSTSSRPSSICSESEPEQLTRWVDMVTLPLMMAYVTRYIFGTDKLRPNAFEVRGLNGISTGIIHCDDSAILSQWLKYITDNIIGLTHLQVRKYLFHLKICEINSMFLLYIFGHIYIYY